jgi:hypothetical protein
MCAACERIRERIKEWRNKRKKKKKIREIKKKKGGHYRHFTFTQSGEAVLPNIF